MSILMSTVAAIIAAVIIAPLSCVLSSLGVDTCGPSSGVRDSYSVNRAAVRARTPEGWLEHVNPQPQR